MGPALARPEGIIPAGPGNRRLAWELAAILVFAAWRWGGLHRADAPFFMALAAVLFIEALGLFSRSGPGSGTKNNRSWWRRDLFFWSGLAFLAYLGCQWWNGGRELGYDEQARCWAYSPPRHPFWPWAVTRPDAAQMLQWFFPAWTIGLALRSPFLARRDLRGLLRGLLVSAGALAVAGMVPLITRAPNGFWRMPPGCDSFAAFGYGNHAAAYFVLLGAVAAGLLFHEGFRRDRPVNKVTAGGFLAALLLCLLGADLSLSRTGIVLAWILAAGTAGYGLARSWRRLRPAGRLRWGAATVAAGIVLYFTVLGAGGPAIRTEFRVKRPPRAQLIPAWQTVNLDLSDRPRLWNIAWQVFKAHPVYGVGGWGFRYLAGFHLPADMRNHWDNNYGRSNVHCDPLQFLTEFGLAGAGLMTAALGALLAPLFRPDLHRGAVFTFTGIGLALVLAFSLIDLPFRCPAILWTWTALFAALPKLTIRKPPPSPPGMSRLPAASPAGNPKDLCP